MCLSIRVVLVDRLPKEAWWQHGFKGQVTSRFSPTLDRMVKRSCFDTKHQTSGSAGTIPRKSRSVDEYLRNLFHTICLTAQRTVCGVYHKDSCAKERQIIANRAFAPVNFTFSALPSVGFNEGGYRIGGVAIDSNRGVGRRGGPPRSIPRMESTATRPIL